MSLDRPRAPRVEVNVHLHEMSTETLERIRSIGMDLTRTLEKIRVATGTIEQDRLEILEHTAGVESVEVSRAVTALPTAATDVTV